MRGSLFHRAGLLPRALQSASLALFPGFPGKQVACPLLTSHVGPLRLQMCFCC